MFGRWKRELENGGVPQILAASRMGFPACGYLVSRENLPPEPAVAKHRLTLSLPIIFDPPTTDLLTHPYWLQRCNIFLFQRPLSIFEGGLKRKMFSLNGHCATKWVGQKMHLGWVGL